MGVVGVMVNNELDYDPRKRETLHCELHDVNIIHRLPFRCPLATERPLDTVHRLKHRAWNGMSQRGDAALDWLIPLNDVQACERCVIRNINHPRVRKLRHAPAEPYRR